MKVPIVLRARYLLKVAETSEFAVPIRLLVKKILRKNNLRLR